MSCSHNPPLIMARPRHFSHFPMYRLISALVLAITLLVVIGCATGRAKDAPPLKQATAEELTALLKQREAALQSLKGLFSAKVRGGILPITTRVEGTLYYERPNALRLRGFTPIGGELFEFLQSDDQFTLRLPTMGRVLSGNGSDTGEMGKLARPFQLSVWAMSGVLGTDAVAPFETVTLSEDGDRYRLDVFGPLTNGGNGLRRRLWFDRQRLLVVQAERLTDSGNIDASIRYDDFRPVGTDAVPVSSPDSAQDRMLRPFKISLEDGRGEGSVQIMFHELIPNQPLKPSDLGRG
ncbi:conserved protein of unknown function [Nitrospira japonica]|uniref:Outer membrane lipoprotein-sorting protein n=1 Tax=Nitrospira japonica TaxID=1325564 RepID=A0A1W1I949_9BACT|nr:hypothetical protein [Nitrospira japonica]SLM49534.1 conserved protein of unknown function [Nitrospira japonica]